MDIFEMVIVTMNGLKSHEAKEDYIIFMAFFLASNILWDDWNYELEPIRDSSINNDIYSFSNSFRSEVKTWFKYFKIIDARNRFFVHFHSISFDPSRATKVHEYQDMEWYSTVYGMR